MTSAPLNGKNIFCWMTVILLAATFSDALRLLTENWMHSAEYGHSFLVAPIIIYIAYIQIRNVSLKLWEKKWGTLFIISLLLAFYNFSLLTGIQTLIYTSAYLGLIFILYFIFGFTILKNLTTPLLLTLFIIPIPEQFYPQLTAPLQLKASQASEYLIKCLDIPLLREGNIMVLPDKSFEIAEACSGLRSVISLTTLSIIIGYFTLSRKGSKIILFISSFPISFGVNIIRILSLIIFYHYFKIDLSEGTPHTLIGIITFLISILIFYWIHLKLEKKEHLVNGKNSEN